MEKEPLAFPAARRMEAALLKREVEATELVGEQIAKLTTAKNPGKALSQTLKTLGAYMDADRVYVFMRHDAFSPNVCEWCAKGVRPDMDTLLKIKKKDAQHFMPALKGGDCVIISGADELKSHSAALFSALAGRNITEAIAAPIFSERKFAGYLGIENASRETMEIMANSLSTLCSFIGVSVHAYREQANSAMQNLRFERERHRYRDALMNGCEYSYSFDVTEGMIRKPFITARGVNIFELLGLSLPVNYDEMNGKFMTSSHLQLANEEMAYNFTCKGLLKQFQSGKTNVVTEYYLPKEDTYTQVSALMSLEQENNHVYAFIIATDITELRKKEAQQRRTLQETKDRLVESNYQHHLLLDSLTLMKDTYYRIGCIDLDRNSMQVIVSPEDEQKESYGLLTDYNGSLQRLAVDYILPEYRAKFLSVLKPARIRALMTDDVTYVDVTYRRLEKGVPHWVRSELMAMPGYGHEHHRVMWYVKDISYEKMMEDRLSQQLIKTNADAHLRLETILGGIAGGFRISRGDDKFTFEYVSPATAAVQGYTVDELMAVTNCSSIDNIYDNDRDRTLSSLYAQLNESESYSVKYRVRHKDGSLKWVQDNGKKVVAEDKTVLYYSLLQDITQQEQQSIDLHNAMTMQTQMVNSLSSGIWAYTLPERQTLILNPEAKRLLDCENIASPDFTAIVRQKICPEDVKILKGIKKALKQPGDHVKYVFHINTSAGNILIVQCYTKLLELKDGQRLILSSMIDMTERFHTEALLEEERKQYRNVLIEGSELAFSFDLNDGIIKESVLSQAGKTKLLKAGFTIAPADSYDEIITEWVHSNGLTPFVEGADDILSRSALRSHYKKGEVRVEMEYYAAKTDQYYRVLILLSKSQNDKHVHAIFIAYNTTSSVKETIRREIEQKKKESEAKLALQDAYNAAQRANAAKTNFLANMSHDIRTPMNAIIGLTAIAGTHLDDKDKVANCLSKITISSKHLLGLINEVLDMSKIESGKVDLQTEDFNLPDLIDTLLTISKPQIVAKRQELVVNISDIEHEKVIGDVQRIQQSFMNLLSNAIKYTPEGGRITLSVTEKPTNQHRIGCYRFIFEDNGIGMSQEFLAHLFEPFERAKDSRVEQIQGTGLGMAITKNLVQMMDGDIQVESEPDKGTRFTVTIFLKLQDTNEVIDYEDFIDLPILVADDDKIACESTCDILNELGMKSQWVTTGQDAVRLVIEHHESGDDFFAVILDWKMPNMNGIEATRQIRRVVGKTVPIIIISAYDWSDIEQEARQAGADAFISKPLFKSRVVHLFNDLLGKNTDEKRENSLDSIASQNFNGKRALLVEDNEINTEIAGEILGMAGLEVSYANNGKQAVDIMTAAKDGDFDIIFMDIQMPIMNGYDATRAIRSLSNDYVKRVPIIAMTANAFADDVAAAMAAGMSEHIAKPLDFDKLLHILKKWLA